MYRPTFFFEVNRPTNLCDWKEVKRFDWLLCAKLAGPGELAFSLCGLTIFADGGLLLYN